MNEFVANLFVMRRERNAHLPAYSLSKKDLNAWELGIAGACAGIAYNLSLFPADLVNLPFKPKRNFDLELRAYHDQHSFKHSRACTMLRAYEGSIPVLV